MFRRSVLGISVWVLWFFLIINFFFFNTSTLGVF